MVSIFIMRVKNFKTRCILWAQVITHAFVVHCYLNKDHQLTRQKFTDQLIIELVEYFIPENESGLRKKQESESHLYSPLKSHPFYQQIKNPKEIAKWKDVTNEESFIIVQLVQPKPPIQEN